MATCTMHVSELELHQLMLPHLPLEYNGLVVQ
jgi:hypothetical protein